MTVILKEARRLKDLVPEPRFLTALRSVQNDPEVRSALKPLLLVVLVAFFGCQKADTIQTYSAPKEPKREASPLAAAAPQGEPTDRLLTAIIPSGGQAWFFKVVAPIAEVDKHEKELTDFFTAVRFADDGKPKWNLPAGWKEQATNSPMRFATIVIPTEPKPLEIAVSSLPWSGTPENLLQNVNRWRGQLQLPQIGAGQVAEFTREAKAGDLPITIVDLRGHFAGSGMTPPFAGPMAGAAGPNTTGARPELPPGHPPIDSAPPAATTNSQPTGESPAPSATPPAAAPGSPKFTTPSDWKQLPAGGMRKAAFEIGDPAQKNLVTLIDFPADAGPMIANPLQNINRWRREVGLPEIKQDEIPKASEQIEVDGQPATLVRAIPDASQSGQSQANRATLAAMAKSGNIIWFIKLTGDRNVVAAQEDNFKSFLKSLRFAPGGGATDGHN
jgi:hypothetical protein